MRTKLNEPVNNAGEITTINELDKRGLIFFEKSERFQTKRGISTKYFAVVKGTDTKEGIRSGWEIGKTAYLSKTKQAIEFGGGKQNHCKRVQKNKGGRQNETNQKSGY